MPPFRLANEFRSRGILDRFCVRLSCRAAPTTLMGYFNEPLNHRGFLVCCHLGIYKPRAGFLDVSVWVARIVASILLCYGRLVRDYVIVRDCRHQQRQPNSSDRCVREKAASCAIATMAFLIFKLTNYPNSDHAAVMIGASFSHVASRAHAPAKPGNMAPKNINLRPCHPPARRER